MNKEEVEKFEMELDLDLKKIKDAFMDFSSKYSDHLIGFQVMKYPNCIWNFSAIIDAKYLRQESDSLK
jgi:hypothetical protein